MAFQCFDIFGEIERVHLAMAVWAQGDGVFDGVFATMGEPFDMVAFEIGGVVFFQKWCWITT